MNGHNGTARLWEEARTTLAWGTAVLVMATVVGSRTAAWAVQRPSTEGHVPELAAYLDRVQIAEPLAYRHLAVYPVLLADDVELRGNWLTLDAAISRGVLVVAERGAGGSVPVVVVENRSRHEHVFIMAGEMLSGGKQTRTVRNDVVLAPGQRIELDVFCVEAHRWEGSDHFSGAGGLVPQSIQQELRRGADQQRVWSEIARNNAALEAENATGSLELAIKAGPVQDKLNEVRRSILPKVPEGTMGFIFVDRGRALGAELFGRDDLARQLLPKLLDSYAIDCVLLGEDEPGPHARREHGAAIALFHRICRAGSGRAGTPGSGAGIRTRSGGLIGDGVSLGGTLVHYGVQTEDRIIPLPGPHPWMPPERSGDVPERP